MMEAVWAIGWALVALVAWLCRAPDWAIWVPLIIGGLIVPVVALDDL